MSENNKAAAIVSSGCHLKGDLTLSGPLHINGSVEGNIRSTNAVIIGASGSVTGDIHSTALIINGVSIGTMRSANIEILKNGMITGSVYSSQCSVDKGGKVDGKVFVGPTKKTEEKTPSN